MSTFDKKYKHVTVSRPERPKGSARRIQLNDKWVSPEEFTFIADVPVLHQGWELDDWAWLVSHGDRLYILTTNHARPVLQRDPVAFLRELMERYRSAVDDVATALDVALKNDPKRKPSDAPQDEDDQG